MADDVSCYRVAISLLPEPPSAFAVRHSTRAVREPVRCPVIPRARLRPYAGTSSGPASVAALLRPAHGRELAA